jgi:hypothetical protein
MLKFKRQERGLLPIKVIIIKVGDGPLSLSLPNVWLQPTRLLRILSMVCVFVQRLRGINLANLFL